RRRPPPSPGPNARRPTEAQARCRRCAARAGRWDATIPVPAAAGENTRSVTAHDLAPARAAGRTTRGMGGGMLEGRVPEALTFDDVLLVTQRSAVLPSETDVAT